MPTPDLQRLGRLTGRLLGRLEKTARLWPVLPPGVRLALAVSGGPSSLALAWMITSYSSRLERPFEVSAIHVRVGDGLGPQTRSWLEGLGLPILEVEPRRDAGAHGEEEKRRIGAAVRRTLLEAAESDGASHLAVGDDADDVVEVWLAGLCFTGRPEVLPRVRSYLGGAVTLVRPLCELRRRDLGRLAEVGSFPVARDGDGGGRDCRLESVRRALGAFGSDQALVRRQLLRAAGLGSAECKEVRW